MNGIAGQADYTLGPAEELTVGVGGDISPALPRSEMAYVRVNGAGGVADDLSQINADARWIGKFICLRMNGAGVITVKAGAAIPIKVDFDLDNVTDKLILLCTAVNTFVGITRADNT